MSLRIVFAGTPEVAVPTLAALLDSEHEVVAVLTRPPKRRGRSKTLVPSDVARFASSRGLTVIESERPSDPETLGRIQSLHADLGVVVAFGALLRQDVLDALPRGWINLHFSSLPDLRGAAPVQRAIMRGDTEIGCSVFLLEAGLDTGPVYSTQVYPVGGTSSAGSILDYLASRGARQVVDVVDQIQAGTAQARIQDEGVGRRNVTVAPKLDRADSFVDFRVPAQQVADQVRGTTPVPAAWTLLPGGSTMKLGLVTAFAPARAAETNETMGAGPIDGTPGAAFFDGKTVRVICNPGFVALGSVAPAGKRWMPAADWWRGARLEPGTHLGVPVAETGEGDNDEGPVPDSRS